MAVTRISQSSLKQGLKKNKNFVAGIPPILGKFESIATVTVGSGGASSIEFTSIPGTYQHLQIRCVSRDNRTSEWINNSFLQFNSDTAGNYASHLLYGNGTSALALADVTSGVEIPAALSAGPSAGTSTFGAAIIDVLDYASTTKNKTLRSLIGLDDNTRGSIRIRSGLWMSTSAITSIKLYPTPSPTAFVQYSTFALYGIKAP